jgi:hypothetical protein
MTTINQFKRLFHNIHTVCILQLQSRKLKQARATLYKIESDIIRREAEKRAICDSIRQQAYSIRYKDQTSEYKQYLDRLRATSQ